MYYFVTKSIGEKYGYYQDFKYHFKLIISRSLFVLSKTHIEQLFNFRNLTSQKIQRCNCQSINLLFIQTHVLYMSLKDPEM